MGYKVLLGQKCWVTGVSGRWRKPCSGSAMWISEHKHQVLYHCLFPWEKLGEVTDSTQTEQPLLAAAALSSLRATHKVQGCHWGSTTGSDLVPRSFCRSGSHKTPKLGQVWRCCLEPRHVLCSGVSHISAI